MGLAMQLFHCFHSSDIFSNCGNIREMSAFLNDRWGWYHHGSWPPWWASITKTAKDVRSVEMLFNPMILENHNCQHRSKQLSSSVVLNLFQLEESYSTKKHSWTISLIILFEKHTMAKTRNTVTNIFWYALHCLNQPLFSENCSPHLQKWPIMLYLRSEIFVN